MPAFFNTTPIFALDLEACIVILLSALWLQENTCNEEAPPSIFNVCSPSLWIIRTFFSYFLRKTNNWIGSVLFSPSLNSSNHFSLRVFFWVQTTYKLFGDLPCTFFNTQSRNLRGEGIMVIGLPCPFLKIEKRCLNFFGKRFDSIYL